MSSLVSVLTCQGKKPVKEGMQMSIKPVDFQVTVPKTIEVSKLQNDQIQKSLSSQQFQVSLINYKSEEKTRLVQKKESPDKVIMHERKEREPKQKNDRKEGRKNEKRNIAGSIVPESKIDIRL